MPLLLERVRVVLCAPSHPGNIGASCRAMQTMWPVAYGVPTCRNGAEQGAQLGLEHGQVLEAEADGSSPSTGAGLWIVAC